MIVYLDPRDGMHHAIIRMGTIYYAYSKSREEAVEWVKQMASEDRRAQANAKFKSGRADYGLTLPP